MAKSKKYIEPQEDRGAPEWMVTFSDCMTLLLTFFVLLLSFSSFDTDALDNVQQAFGIGCPNSAAQEGFRRGMLAKSEAIKIIEEPEDVLRTVPIRQDWHHEELQPAVLCIESRQFRFACPAYAGQHGQRRRIRDFQRRVKSVNDPGLEDKPII